MTDAIPLAPLITMSEASYAAGKWILPATFEREIIALRQRVADLDRTLLEQQGHVSRVNQTIQEALKEIARLQRENEKLTSMLTMKRATVTRLLSTFNDLGQLLGEPPVENADHAQSLASVLSFIVRDRDVEKQRADTADGKWRRLTDELDRQFTSGQFDTKACRDEPGPCWCGRHVGRTSARVTQKD